ncbi:MAG: hypothetical protein RQ982_10100 [Gammaproteobacteria bacterium]|nr:hypothetical protein [Gammaproteobacteria bacterium]
MYIRLIVIGLVIATSITAVCAAKVDIHKNENSGLLTWTADDDGFRIELIQLLPDFIRAIYAKHNYPKEEIERIAAYCVFGTILKNTSNQHLSYRVSNWRYRIVDDSSVADKTRPVKTQPVKTKTQWLEQWRKAGILFSWTLLPDTGEFAVGDWQQGFTTIRLPRDKSFDLIYTWQLDGVKHEGVLENLSCSPDTVMESK